MDEQLFFNFKINFNLREPKSCNPTLIYAVISYRSKQYKIATNMKVLPKQWDAKRQLCIISRGITRLDNRNNSVANQKLKEILFAFSDFKSILFNSDKFDNIDFKSLLNSIIEPQRKKRKLITHECPTLIMLKAIEGLEIKNSSKLQYANMIKIFQTWLNENNIKDNWYNIDRGNLEAFRDYLVTTLYSVGTINMIMSIIMRELKRVDMIDNWSYDKTRISQIEPLKGLLNRTEMTEEEIALSKEDLVVLYHYADLTERQTEVRDIFILQANCGQRISDIPKLFEFELSDDVDTIVIRQQKRNDKAYIPITPIMREILSKYQSGFKHIQLDSSHTRARINRDIKDICKKIERFNRLSTFKKQKGKNVISIDLPMYQRIHTHTARHSFITNWIREGKDRNTLILISGHANLEMINNVYQHLNDTDKCDMVRRSSGDKSDI